MMEEMRKKITAIETIMPRIEREMVALTESVGALALNVSRLTQMLESHKDIEELKDAQIIKDIAGMRTQMESNAAAIVNINNRIHEAKGAGAVGKWFFGAICTFVGFIVSIVISLFK